MKKIENKQAEGIVKPWLLTMLVSAPLALPTSKKHYISLIGGKQIPEIPDLKLLTCHFSRNGSKTKAYHKLLQR